MVPPNSGSKRAHTCIKVNGLVWWQQRRGRPTVCRWQTIRAKQLLHRAPHISNTDQLDLLPRARVDHRSSDSPHGADCASHSQHNHLLQPVWVERVGLLHHHLEHIQGSIRPTSTFGVDDADVLFQLVGVGGVRTSAPQVDCNCIHVCTEAPLEDIQRDGRIEVLPSHEKDRPAEAVLTWQQNSAHTQSFWWRRHSTTQLATEGAIRLHKFAGARDIEVARHQTLAEEWIVERLQSQRRVAWPYQGHHFAQGSQGSTNPVHVLGQNLILPSQGIKFHCVYP
mmetsp:Transcript_1501/g.3568  ORF Transcript_1501/g.3568 Transcript_1501/m.3568 type:complete len:281 (+) Transcript_1501:462-1304(+)